MKKRIAVMWLVLSDLLFMGMTSPSPIVSCEIPEETYTYYANENLVIYDMPNVMGEGLGEIEKNDEIRALETMVNGWLRVSFGDRFGYVDSYKTRDVFELPKMRFKLSFYTDLAIDNGGWTITASGKELKYGMVASNVYPIGTKIYLEGYGEMVVEDRGGKHFNNHDRLDVFIPRNSGESDKTYRNRVMKLGRTEVNGIIY